MGRKESFMNNDVDFHNAVLLFRKLDKPSLRKNYHKKKCKGTCVKRKDGIASYGLLLLGFLREEVIPRKEKFFFFLPHFGFSFPGGEWEASKEWFSSSFFSSFNVHKSFSFFSTKKKI